MTVVFKHKLIPIVAKAHTLGVYIFMNFIITQNYNVKTNVNRNTHEIIYQYNN